MRTFRLLCCVLLVVAITGVLASVTAGPGDDTVDLRFRLKEGDTRNVRMITEQTISQEIQGQQIDMEQSFAFVFTFAVLEAGAEDTMWVEFTYNSVRFTQDGPMGMIEYDSEDPPDDIPLPARAFAALVGQSMRLRMTDQGRVKEVSGIDEMIDHMIESMGLPAGEMSERMESNLREQFGEEAVKEMTESAMAVYPDGPVSVGDSWHRKVVLTKGFPLIVETTYTLTGRRDGIASIEIASELESNSEAASIEMGPVSLTYELRGEQSGMLNIDEATGWILKSRIEQQSSGRMHISGGPEGMEEMSWPIEIESVVTTDDGSDE